MFSRFLEKNQKITTLGFYTEQKKTVGTHFFLINFKVEHLGIPIQYSQIYY